MEPETNGRAPCALVVEDERLIRMYVCSILEDAGFCTLEARNAEEAFDVLQIHARKIALLFTDVAMPGADSGLVLAERCAAQWPEIAIVVASGKMIVRPDQLPSGAAFLSKPFSADDVHQTLNKLLPRDQKA